MSTGCCRRLCCMLFCCKCNSAPDVTTLTAHNAILPRSEITFNYLDKQELHCFGVVPENLRVYQLSSIIHNPQTRIKKIVCGNNHCLILLDNNELYGFGSNEEGQLGINLTSGVDTKYKEELVQLKFMENIRAIKEVNEKSDPNSLFTIEDIAAGDNYSLVLIAERLNNSTIRKFILKFGVNLREKYKDKMNDSIKTVFADDEFDDDEINNGNLTTITNIYAFSKRKMVKTSDQKIYISGVDFAKNKLESYILLPTNFLSMQNKIENLCMGYNHCVILTEQNDLYGIGDNTYGELGEDEFTSNEFKKINLVGNNVNTHLSKGNIKKVVTGSRHTLILTKSGRIYCMGDNSDNQCFGSDNRVPFPMEVIVKTGGQQIVDIFTGYAHNLILLSNGSIMTWGDAKNGMLGYDEEYFTSGKPKDVLCLKQKYICGVGMGSQMTVIFTGGQENSLTRNVRVPQREPHDTSSTDEDDHNNDNKINTKKERDLLGGF